MSKGNTKPVPSYASSTGPQARTKTIAHTPSGAKLSKSKVSVTGLNQGVMIGTKDNGKC